LRETDLVDLRNSKKFGNPEHLPPFKKISGDFAILKKK